MNRILSDDFQMLNRKTNRRQKKMKFMKKLKNKSSNKYSMSDSKSYLKMFSFNWDDQKLKAIRTNPFDNLNANAFYYYINSAYFPENIKNFTENEEESQIVSFLNERIKSICNQKIEKTDLIQTNEETYDTMSDLISLIHLNNSSDAEENINLVLRKIKEKNEKLISQIIPKNFHKLDNFDWKEERHKYLNYLKNKHDDYITTLKRKKVITRFKDELEIAEDFDDVEEMNCMICNDGNTINLDSTVTCSQCGIYVHTTCYGVSSQYNHLNWYCDVCKFFNLEEAEELECILCSVKGGAMKQCDVKMSSMLYKNFMKLREMSEYKNNYQYFNKKHLFNKEIHKYHDNFNEIFTQTSSFFSRLYLDSKGGSNEVQAKIEKIQNLFVNKHCDDSYDIRNYDKNYNCHIHEADFGKFHDKDNLSLNNTRGRQKDDKLNCLNNNTIQNSTNSENSTSYHKNEEDNESFLSNIFTYNKLNEAIHDQPKKILTNKRRASNVWIHLSCAMWTDGIIITKNKREIKNVESIAANLQSYKETCHICNFSNFGPVRNCDEADCNFKFHVECARINHYHMQIEMEGNKLKHKIFCNNHRNNKILNLINLRNIKQAEDVLNFAEVLEKNLKLFKPKKNSIKKEKCILKTKLTKGEKLNFLTQLRYVCKLFSNYKNIVIQKKSKNLKLPFDLNSDDNSFVINLLNPNFQKKYELDKSSFLNRLEYEDIKNSSDFPWDMIKLNNLNRNQIRKIFLKLIPNESVYKKVFTPLTPNNNDKYNKKSLLCNFNPTQIDRTSNIENSIKISDISSFPINNLDNKSNSITADEEEEDRKYCICKGNNIDDDLMISCNREEKCLGAFEGWYHKNCMIELSDKTEAELSDPNYVYICEKCRE